MKATYIKTQIKNVINVTKIVTIHYYEFDKNFTFDGEKHDFWEMVYIDKGKVEVQSEKDKFTLNQGEIIFHRPNEFHAIKAIDSSPNFFVISFVCNSPLIKYFEKYHTTLNKELKTFISSIISESESTYVIPKNDTALKQLNKVEMPVIGGEQLIKTYLEQLLIFLLRNILKVKKTSVFPSKEGMENHIVTSIKEYIEKNAYIKFNITSICKAIGYSKSYLSKIFNNQTGFTIYNYSIEVKIKKAKQLIREGKYNFAEISDLLSFDNPQYFSRVFKRTTNMTPTEFKQTLEFKN
jgi:AraC-like DNA-binding protein/quercetin dioxygenase-like cupin family protein